MLRFSSADIPTASPVAKFHFQGVDAAVVPCEPTPRWCCAPNVDVAKTLAHKPLRRWRLMKVPLVGGFGAGAGVAVGEEVGFDVDVTGCARFATDGGRAGAIRRSCWHTRPRSRN